MNAIVLQVMSDETLSELLRIGARKGWTPDGLNALSVDRFLAPVAALTQAEGECLIEYLGCS